MNHKTMLQMFGLMALSQFKDTIKSQNIKICDLPSCKKQYNHSGRYWCKDLWCRIPISFIFFSYVINEIETDFGSRFRVEKSIDGYGYDEILICEILDSAKNVCEMDYQKTFLDLFIKK